MTQGPSWDLVADLQLLLQFHFMQNALIAGTLVALVAGAAGYFVVLRGQSFVTHMLSQVGFPGAAAGVLVHVSPVVGLIVFCVAAALGVGWLNRDLDAGRRSEAAAVGNDPVLLEDVPEPRGVRAAGDDHGDVRPVRICSRLRCVRQHVAHAGEHEQHGHRQGGQGYQPASRVRNPSSRWAAASASSPWREPGVRPASVVVNRSS